ncbi:GDP-L-fucose synthase family protein [Sphingomonas nostoxanthinifaciens]|uniref:GDP-L-fucose synthase family protein n=1 Tax=Sphingomonas nostoxanthinifaciens TaxID=2872652 RepID=UPI001CC1EB73|nr:GDP-L-fucose synthase [Sphingomonas nostoxanthinifaciens]UAK24999.1 GDP-L-fucose synthase [Sphingomonas nostoxanthinifaciens]
MTGTIFVTGSGGMVGRNLLEHAHAAGYRILAPRRAELDLRDAEAVSRYVAAHRPDLIIQIAGKVGGIEANRREPSAFLVENIQIGLNVVLAAREQGVPQLLNLASSCMYPRDHLDPLQEDMVLTGMLEPTNEGYALAKIATARLCRYIRTEEPALRYKTIIPCNIYGRHDSFDPIRSHLVPATLRKVWEAQQAGSPAVSIWGDGTARREFMYAEDLADFVWEAVERFDDLPDEINAGLGDDYSVNDYYHVAAQIVGWDGRFVHELDRPAGMARKLVDVGRQRAFGWQPRFTLEEGMRRTYEYFLGKQARSAAGAVAA